MLIFIQAFNDFCININDKSLYQFFLSRNMSMSNDSFIFIINLTLDMNYKN